MSIQTSTPDSSPKLSAADCEEAALGTLVKMGSRKRFLVRVIERLIRPVFLGLERLRPAPPSPGGEVNRILILEYWNLGDVVMLSPFLRSLRNQYPNASVTLLTSPKTVPLLENTGLVDKLVVVRVPWAQHYSRWRKYSPFTPLWIELLRTIRMLRLERFDLAFSARADLRENFIMWLAEVNRRVGYGFGGGAFFLTDVAIPDLENPHFSRRWLRLLETVGKRPTVREPLLHVTSEERSSAERCLAQGGIPNDEFVVGIHPGARSAIRQWGEENFRDTGKAVTRRILTKDRLVPRSRPRTTRWRRSPSFLAPASIHGCAGPMSTLDLQRQWSHAYRHCFGSPGSRDIWSNSACLVWTSWNEQSHCNPAQFLVSSVL